RNYLRQHSRRTAESWLRDYRIPACYQREEGKNQHFYSGHDKPNPTCEDLVRFLVLSKRCSQLRKHSRAGTPAVAMILIDIKPQRWGWKVFETPGVDGR